jgi:hypothetical protein
MPTPGSQVAGGRVRGRILAGQGCRGFKDGSDALFNGPRGVALAPDGRLFIADSGNYRIRCLSPSNSSGSQPSVESVAGDGAKRSRDGALHDASIAFPYGLAWDASSPGKNALFTSEWEGHRIRRVDLDNNKVSTLAGTGRAGFRDGPASEALFDEPCMLACDDKARVYVADSRNDAIRVVVPPHASMGGGSVATVITLIGRAPSGSLDHVPFPMIECTLSRPWGVCLAPDGSLLVTDGKAHCVRRVPDVEKYLTPQFMAERALQAAASRHAYSASEILGGEARASRAARPLSPTAELLDWRHAPVSDATAAYPQLTPPPLPLRHGVAKRRGSHPREGSGKPGGERRGEGGGVEGGESEEGSTATTQRSPGSEYESGESGSYLSMSESGSCSSLTSTPRTVRRAALLAQPQPLLAATGGGGSQGSGVRVGVGGVLAASVGSRTRFFETGYGPHGFGEERAIDSSGGPLGGANSVGSALGAPPDGGGGKTGAAAGGDSRDGGEGEEGEGEEGKVGAYRALGSLELAHRCVCVCVCVCVCLCLCLSLSSPLLLSLPLSLSLSLSVTLSLGACVRACVRA